jgi:ABC-2 type transport system ATP-binding protein
VRRAIGVIPQALTSDPDLTAAENLDFYGKLYSLPRTPRRGLVDELLEAVDLSDWRNKIVGTFSGGMRRRLEIARSLIHRPRVLFLDEPTTGLDPASRIAMWDMLRRLKAQTAVTLFLTTHYMEEADQLCDHIAIFGHGRIVAQGTPAHLKAQASVTETIEVGFAASPPSWADTLRRLPGSVAVEIAQGTYRIKSRDRMATVSSLMSAVRLAGLEITSLIVRGQTLEDVFIQHTGRDLRDAADEKRRMDVGHLYERRPRG